MGSRHISVDQNEFREGLARKRVDIAEFMSARHRHQVIKLLEQGESPMRIAAQLRRQGVITTEEEVKLEKVELFKRWAKQNTKHISAIVNDELRKLDELEWVALNMVLLDEERETGDVVKALEKSEVQEVSAKKATRSRAVEYIEIVLKIQERRAKLLGLEKVMKVTAIKNLNVTGPMTRMSDDDLETIIAQPIAQLEAGDE